MPPRPEKVDPVARRERARHVPEPWGFGAVPDDDEVRARHRRGDPLEGVQHAFDALLRIEAAHVEHDVVVRREPERLARAGGVARTKALEIDPRRDHGDRRAHAAGAELLGDEGRGRDDGIDAGGEAGGHPDGGRRHDRMV